MEFATALKFARVAYTIVLQPALILVQINYEQACYLESGVDPSSTAQSERLRSVRKHRTASYRSADF